jgi:hypothetical protein
VKTTGKTLEEIDLIFAKPEIRDSALAARTVHDRRHETAPGSPSVAKSEAIEYEEKEDV